MNTCCRQACRIAPATNRPVEKEKPEAEMAEGNVDLEEAPEAGAGNSDRVEDSIVELSSVRLKRFTFTVRCISGAAFFLAKLRS